ncbi:MAG: diaminopimelate epimerase [Acidobacteriota bacterium]
MTLIAVSKYHAYGNDFLVLRSREVPVDRRGEWTRLLCRRHEGIGADGCVFVAPREDGAWDFRIFNQDGGEAEMSGNGLRCAAAFLAHRGLVAGEVVRFATAAGPRAAELVAARYPEWSFRSEMGRPSFAPADLPYTGPFRPGPGGVALADLEVPGGRLEVTLVSVGNPQAVIFVDRLPDETAYRRWGEAIAGHPGFPRQTNVSFVRVADRHALDILIWERGVGPTTSSGTGCTGAAVAALARGKVESPVEVRAPGGAQEVTWRPGESAYLTGWVRFVMDGYWEVAGSE